MAEEKGSGNNPMKEIRIEKLTLNVGCAGDKNQMERAQNLIKIFTDKKSVITKSHKRSTFGITKGRPVGVMVTLRKKEAEEVLKLTLTGVENRLKASQFDDSGNFSFGIKEYIDIAGIKYNHDVGMMGFDVAVTLERAGHRIKRRRIKTAKIPKDQKISKSEAMQWVKSKFGVQIV